MGISKDPYGHPNEIFQEGVCGDGLIRALVILMNKLKENPSEYPAAMELCNVTSIYKKKGDRNEFDLHRFFFWDNIIENNNGQINVYRRVQQYRPKPD